MRVRAHVVQRLTDSATPAGLAWNPHASRNSPDNGTRASPMCRFIGTHIARAQELLEPSRSALLPHGCPIRMSAAAALVEGPS